MSLVIRKNGNRVGSIVLNHNKRPLDAPVIHTEGKHINSKRMRKNENVYLSGLLLFNTYCLTDVVITYI